MLQRKPWIPPPAKCEGSKSEIKSAIAENSYQCNCARKQEKNQPNLILDIIANELTKVEGLVTSLDQLLQQQSLQDTTGNLNQNGRNLKQRIMAVELSEVEKKSNMGLVDQQISYTKVSLDSVAKILLSKACIQGSQEKKILELQMALKSIEQQYKKDIANLKDTSKSYRKRSKEAAIKLKAMEEKLLFKEEELRCLGRNYDGLKASLTDIEKQKLQVQGAPDLRTQTENKELSMENLNQSKEIERLKAFIIILEEQLLRDKQTMADLTRKLEKFSDDEKCSIIAIKGHGKKENLDYEHQLRILERKLKKSQKTIYGLTKGLTAESGDLTLQQKRKISSLTDSLKVKDEEMRTLSNERLQLSNRFESETRVLRLELNHALKSNAELQSELDLALGVNAGLRTHLQRLRKSYATIFKESVADPLTAGDSSMQSL